MLQKEQVIETLKTVEDPELGIDVWTLGLIYDIKIEEEKLSIKMTFTSPMCPYGPMMVEEIKTKLKSSGVQNIDVEIVFSPPWVPSDELKAALGFSV